MVLIYKNTKEKIVPLVQFLSPDHGHDPLYHPEQQAITPAGKFLVTDPKPTPCAFFPHHLYYTSTTILPC